jgi:colanic acid/amylovoran biosynthesis glycosyltransferase
MNERRLLLVAPMLRVPTRPDGRIVLTRKFIEGMTFYCNRWPGKVAVAAQIATGGDTNLDHVECEASSLPFATHIVRFTNPDQCRPLLSEAAVVLGSLDPSQAAWAPLCREMRTPLVYISEYSQRTRQQIIDATTANPIRRWVRHWKVRRAEQICRGAIPLAAGLQCNGTPTFNDYKNLNANALLYFDTRCTQPMLATDEQIKEKTNELLAGGSLRLAFSGRLIPMKGADRLVPLSVELMRRGVLFTLTICGDGPLRASMQQQAESAGLEERISFRGVLDFESELVPFVRRQVDLFINSHPQGDPSCTYLETMTCGTPIVGFDNEAFAGLCAASGVGWATPSGDVVRLAERIAELNRGRHQIATAATQSRDFAAEHTFEKTFEARVAHLLQCGNLDQPAAPPAQTWPRLSTASQTQRS